MAGITTIADYPLPAGTLPHNAVEWVARPWQAVLLVHDMQRFFVASLPDPLRTELVGNTAELVQRRRAIGVPVASTAQASASSSTTQARSTSAATG